jgi:hypothetical protein
MAQLEHRAAVNTIQITSFKNEMKERKKYIRGLRNKPEGPPRIHRSYA